MHFGLFCIVLVQTVTVIMIYMIASNVMDLQNDMQSLHQQGKLLMSAIDNLKAAVAAQTSVDASAVTLIEGIAAQLKGSSDTEVQALADQLSTATKPLADAVAANTIATNGTPGPSGPATSSGSAPAA